MGMTNEELLEEVKREIGKAAADTAADTIKLLETARSRTGTLPGVTPAPISAEEVKKRVEDAAKTLAFRDSQLLTYVQSMETRLTRFIQDSTTYLDHQIKAATLPAPADTEHGELAAQTRGQLLQAQTQTQTDLASTRRSVMVGIVAPIVVAIAIAVMNRLPATAPPPIVPPVVVSITPPQLVVPTAIQRAPATSAAPIITSDGGRP